MSKRNLEKKKLSARRAMECKTKFKKVLAALSLLLIASTLTAAFTLQMTSCNVNAAEQQQPPLESSEQQINQQQEQNKPQQQQNKPQQQQSRATRSELATTPHTPTFTSTQNNNNKSHQQQQADNMRLPLYTRLLATCACLFIFLVGVMGNLLVPLVVIKTKYLRNSTNLFIINLSVADLLVLIVCMPTVLIELHSRPETWLLGEPMCKYYTSVCVHFELIYFSESH